MTNRRLFVVDAMALAFRSYHAFSRPLTTSSGLPTQAVYGSLMFLMNLIEKERPDYLVIATDSREKTFRHELFPAYKANRSDMPEDLAIQLPYLFRAFEALGCKLMKKPGLEADDLIGSLVHQFKDPELECYIVSGDKDFMQLVDDTTFLYSPKKGGEVKVVDEAGVVEKFGVKPNQVIDLLAIMGDSSDNVPGVAGIGEKGASKLIQSFGSLDEIYNNIEKITAKRQRNGLDTCKEKAYLSRELVTIKVDEPIPFDLEAISCNPEDAISNDQLLALTQELELRTLHSRVQKLQEKKTSENTGLADDVSSDQDREDVEYQIIDDDKKLEVFLDAARKQSVYCFDTETTGLDISSDRPIGVSFSWQAEQAFYLPLNQDQKADPSKVKQELDQLLSKGDVLKVGHNIKFDLQMLNNIGIKVEGPFADTMVASYLLNANERSHNLDACCLRYLNYKKIPTIDLLGKSGTMVDVPIETLSRYACEDADLTFQLYEYLIPKLGDRLSSLYTDIEMPLIPVIAKMEQEGVYIDTNKLSDQSKDLGARSEALKQKIYEIAGEEFNIQSPKQLQEILFEKLAIHEQLGIKRIKKTKSGYSTDVSVLEKLSEHPIASALLEFRTVSKLKSTYVDALPKLVSKESDRLHTSFHQTGTATGRLSSSEPNLQNIPIKSELGKKIREAFKPKDPEKMIISADYSQIELRVLASLSKDQSLIDAFKNDADIHRITASNIFGIPENQVSPEQRNQAKAINFGIIYGMGPQRLARETGVSTKEAKSFIDKYFEQYPLIKDYIDSSIQFAKEHEYTETLKGRRRPIPEINTAERLALVNAQNIAINSPVQGTAADLIKIAMVKIQKKLDQSSLNAKMLMQVHDELVFECPKDELEEVRTIVKESMENALDIGVPLKVVVGTGSNWLEAH